MKENLILLVVLFFAVPSFSQIKESCIPSNLIVVTKKLNFREGPKANGRIIDSLDIGEALSFIRLKELDKRKSIYGYGQSWLEVKRELTGEVGFVYGKYVMQGEMAYLNGFDSDIIQNGNWYGITHNMGEIGIEKANTILIKAHEDFEVIKSENKHKIIICSQHKINEGSIDGRYFGQGKLIKLGERMPLISIGDNRFSLIITGEYKLKEGRTFRRNEKMIFLTTTKIDSEKRYFEQDLTDCLSLYGEGGLRIHFEGDIDDDEKPELIFSEGSSQSVVLYYFKSNQDGILKLVSKTYAWSKC